MKVRKFLTAFVVVAAVFLLAACASEKQYKNKYNVVFWCEGEVILSYTLEEGEKITRLPDMPAEQAGYDWNIEPLPDAVYKDTTIRITRSPKTFTVTFQSDYGYIYPDTLDFKFNSIMRDMPIPEREGYEFIGYRYGNKLYNSDSVFDIPDNVTMTAAWRDLFGYEETDFGIKINSYWGTSGTVVIPSEIDGMDVTDIEKGIFNGVSVQSLSVPSLTAPFDYIGYFFGLEREESSQVPTSLREVFIRGGETIADSAFYDCSRLSVIELPDSITSIGDYAFYNCRSLKDINLYAVTEIGDYAFYNCGNSDFTELSLPKVAHIGKHAFENCSSLTDVTVNKVETIEEYAFFNCSSLRNVDISAGNPPVLGEYVFYRRATDEEYIVIPNLKIRVPTPVDYRKNRYWIEYADKIDMMTTSGMGHGDIK